jgi:hypothetical protein
MNGRARFMSVTALQLLRRPLMGPHAHPELNITTRPRIKRESSLLVAACIALLSLPRQGGDVEGVQGIKPTLLRLLMRILTIHSREVPRHIVQTWAPVVSVMDGAV